MLEHDSAYAGSHLALALVARERGDLELAQSEAAAARKYWKDADSNLEELAEVRALESGARESRNALASSDRISSTSAEVLTAAMVSRTAATLPRWFELLMLAAWNSWMCVAMRQVRRSPGEETH
jgi:hypothetical protein